MISLVLFKSFCVMIAFGIASSNANDCECDEHILCLYPTSKPGPACDDFKEDGFLEEEKSQALQRINEYRNKVALGNEKQGSPGPQPQAANMMEVTWDDYLGSTAQRYADQCIHNHHSSKKCRLAEKFHFGENLAWGKGRFGKDAFLGHIDRWYDEVKDFPSYIVDVYNPTPFKVIGVQIGHYAQLVNAKTYKIGCGKSRWGKENMLVCHFGPTIYVNEPLYASGKPASMCQKGTKSSYEGLCALGSRCRPSAVLLALLIFFSFTRL